MNLSLVIFQRGENMSDKENKTNNKRTNNNNNNKVKKQESKPSTRQVILNILNEVEQENAYSNITINKQIKKHEVEEVGFLREVVYGVIENKIYLDYILSKLITKGFNKLETPLLNVLRMGLYQIIYLDSVPEYAAVNECVNMTRKISPKHASFVNGVLRNYSRKKDTIKLPDKKNDYISYLSVKYSFSKWIIRKWAKTYDKDFLEELLSASNETPPLTIRVNTLKITKEDLKEKLIEKGFEVTDGKYNDEALNVKGSNLIFNNELYTQGYFQIQDESSMLAVKVLDPQPDDLVIDVCAAPGSKTMFTSEMMKNEGLIIARDIFDHKLQLLSNDIERLGVDIIKTEKFDALNLDEMLIEKADRVLVDAPCSGLGVIRRKPEIKYNRTEAEVKELVKMQYKILQNSSKYVKNNGFLIYSTCTITEEENIEVVDRFLKENAEFSIETKDLKVEEKLINKDGTIRLYPNIHGTDGFFICKMRKNNDN